MTLADDRLRRTGRARAAARGCRHLHDGSLHALDPEAVGFHLVPPLDEGGRSSSPPPRAPSRSRSRGLTELVGTLGRVPEKVGDAPGLVLGRVVCQLINEAAFLVGEGHGSAADVDAGLELGVNHPRGPVSWSRELGLQHVVSLLGALQSELGEERYRDRRRCCSACTVRARSGAPSVLALPVNSGGRFSRKAATPSP